MPSHRLPDILGIPPERHDRLALPAPGRGLRTGRPPIRLAHADPGGGTPPQQSEVHGSAAGLSGSETQVDLDDSPDDPTDPEEPPNQPLAGEARAVVVYAARNLVNTVDTRPVGTAWFSA